MRVFLALMLVVIFVSFSAAQGDRERIPREKKNLAMLQGNWQVVKIETGADVDDEVAASLRTAMEEVSEIKAGDISFAGNEIGHIVHGKFLKAGLLTLDPTASPAIMTQESRFDETSPVLTHKAIYKIEKGILSIAYRDLGKPGDLLKLPSSFNVKENPTTAIVHLKKVEDKPIKK